MEKGKIIVIEGTDKSGKQTQSQGLLARLNSEGLPCEMMSFPRYHTPTGRIVGQCYLGKDLGPGDSAWFGDADSVPATVAIPYYATDRLFAVPEIERILESGKHLIIDRWVESNKGHQGGKAKTEQERQEIIQYIDDIEYGVMRLPRPDLVLFLYMPHEVAMQLPRAEAADGHEINAQHLKNAEETYLSLAKANRGWKQINCSPNKTFPPRKEDDIHEEVFEHVVTKLF